MTEITICRDADDLAGRAASLFEQAAQEATLARGRFAVALAGGSTPEKTYTLLAGPARVSRVDWSRTFVFFGDERWVPPEDERSNYGMAWRTLLDKAPIPDANIYPVSTDTVTAAQSATYYADTVAQFFDVAPGGPPPAFDLILLGLGDDGHTASLFPGAPSLDVADAWVTWSTPGTLPPPVDRITFTYPLLNAARRIVFLVAGQKKAEAVHDVLEGDAPRERRPAAGVQPANGTVTWLLDEAAAAQLTRRA